MDNQELIDIAIIAWIVIVFVFYHLQYIKLSHTFLNVYASRYAPFLVPILSPVIP